MTQATDLIKNAASRSQSPEAKRQKAKKKMTQQSEKTRLTLNDGGSGPSGLEAGRAKRVAEREARVSKQLSANETTYNRQQKVDMLRKKKVRNIGLKTGGGALAVGGAAYGASKLFGGDKN